MVPSCWNDFCLKPFRFCIVTTEPNGLLLRADDPGGIFSLSGGSVSGTAAGKVAALRWLQLISAGLNVSVRLSSRLLKFPHRLNMNNFRRVWQQEACWKLISECFPQFIIDGAAHQFNSSVHSCRQPTSLRNSVSWKHILEAICLVVMFPLRPLLCHVSFMILQVFFSGSCTMFDCKKAVRIKCSWLTFYGACFTNLALLYQSMRSSSVQQPFCICLEANLLCWECMLLSTRARNEPAVRTGFFFFLGWGFF